MTDHTPTQDDVAAVFAFAGLTVTPERVAEHYETYATTLALIRQASPPGLGETVPAVAFSANWD